MHKKILRILSALLVMVLLIGMCPIGTQAATTEPNALKKEVEDLYKLCLRTAGVSSFHGYCGALVSWQIYKLGITKGYMGANGNDQYDTYKNLDYTSGGYRVRPYPATKYNLKAALNAISENGTKDVYNILIGFQKTNTVAGQKFGHCVLINAIVDGVVYFSESYPSTMAGKYYKEGAAITCSIDQFVRFYANWTVFEGAIHFDLKTYNESCTYYPAYLNAGVLENTQMYSAPCQTEVDDRSQPLRQILAGERITVTGLYQNTEGEFWYQVQDTQTGYIPADKTQMLDLRYEDITASGLVAPAELKQGSAFDVKGVVKSQYNQICTIRGQVFRYEDGGQTHVMSTTDLLDGQSYSLSRSKLSDALAFRKLQLGSYRYELAVVVGNYYFADGTLQTEWKTLKLWLSDFQVVSQKGNTYSVTFDANGGTASLNAAEVAAGGTLAALPEAQREGYVFDGWYTVDGGRVTSDLVVTSDMTLCAKWKVSEDFTGWTVENGQWVYLENGQAKTGFLTIDGIIYHINAEGLLDTDWVTIDGRKYYFNGNGALHLGWLETADGTYYLTENGALTGEAEIDGKTYIFRDDGTLEA